MSAGQNGRVSAVGVKPGTISPRRAVPASIARPHYVDAKPGIPADLDDPMVKDADTIGRMRVAGRIAADAIVEVGRHITPGITTDELDRIGHEFIIAAGGYPSTLGYKDYPKSLCTSVNEVICHGIPDSRPLQDGDVVKVDITAYVDGVHGDNCATFYAGAPTPQVRDLGERTREAMMRGIGAVRPGRPVSVIGRVIESYARRFGYGVVREFTGHGIGTAFHSGLIIPHYDEPRFDDEILPGMTFTIEPMLNLGTPDWVMWDDGWTVVTADGRRSAQFEHTLLVTADGAEVLTHP
jgi:methionyl aminopeptidase